MDATQTGAKSDITPEQARAARGLLNWSRDQLSAASGVPERTTARFESGETTPRRATIAAIRQALEAAGVEFIAENGGGPGVRLVVERSGRSWWSRKPGRSGRGKGVQGASAPT